VCVRPDGVTSFSHDMTQLASASGNVAALVFFVLDLLHLDGPRRPMHRAIAVSRRRRNA
jgi:hypothetical protein